MHLAQVISSGSNINPQAVRNLPPVMVPPLIEHCILVAAILLTVLSLYLFFQAVALQRFALRETKDAPNAWSGTAIVLMSVPLIVVLLGTAGSLRALEQGFLPLWIMQKTGQDLVIQLIWYYPLALLPGFALASILPAAIAIYKFRLAGNLSGQDDERAARFRIKNASVGIFAAVINFVASIATLITFFWMLSK